MTDDPLHGPRTGPGAAGHGRASNGYLRSGSDPLRAADGSAAVPRRDGSENGAAGHLARAGAAVAVERPGTARPGDDLPQVPRQGTIAAIPRLGDGGPVELRQRTGQIERELALVETFQKIRYSHHDPVFAAARMSRAFSAYEAAFRQAGLIDRSEDAAIVAARIRATGIAPALLRRA